MRNGYILLTEVLMDMQKMRGTVIQAGQRLFGTSDPKAHAAATELEDIPRRVQAAMDILVEVQGLMPEPTKGDIVRHYNPDAVNVKPLVLDPEAFLGTLGPGKAVYFVKDGEEVVDEEPAKPEHYDQWISSECMMLLEGLNLIDKAGLIELGLPRDKLDLMGRILEDQRKRLTDSLAKKLDKVVLPHVE